MGVAADQAAGPAGAGAAAPAPAATNFDWTTSVEPHAARRRAILAKYGPQVRALYGTDAWTGVQVCWVEGGEEGGSWDGGVSVCQPGGTKDRNVRAAPFFFFRLSVAGQPRRPGPPTRPPQLYPCPSFWAAGQAGPGAGKRGGCQGAVGLASATPGRPAFAAAGTVGRGERGGGGRAVAAPAGAALWEGRPPGPRSRLWDRLPAVQVPDADGGPPTARARDRVGRGCRSPVPGREQKKQKKTDAPAPARRASPLARRPPPTHTSNRPFLSPSLPLLPPS